MFNLESGTVSDLDFYILDTIGVQQAHFFMPGNYLCFQGTFNRVIMDDIENPIMLPETVSYNIMWQKQGNVFSPFYFDRNNVSNSVVAKELEFDEGRYDYTYKKDDLIMFLGEDDLLSVGGLFSPDLTESLMGTGVYEGLFCEIYTVIEKTGLATLTAELKVPAGENFVFKTISAIGISFSRTFIDVDTDKIELSFFLSDFDGKFKAVKVTGTESEGEIDEQTVDISIKVLGESSGGGGGSVAGALMSGYFEDLETGVSASYSYSKKDLAECSVSFGDDPFNAVLGVLASFAYLWNEEDPDDLMLLAVVLYIAIRDSGLLSYIGYADLSGEGDFEVVNLPSLSCVVLPNGEFELVIYVDKNGLKQLKLTGVEDDSAIFGVDMSSLSFSVSDLSSSGGGSGGGSLQEQQLYLYDYDWQDMSGTYEATKYISGIDYDSMIWYSAETSSLEDFADAGVVMTEQGYGQVTFSCKEVPQNQISVLVRWQ
jgi:hypothetical protein